MKLIIVLCLLQIVAIYGQKNSTQSAIKKTEVPSVEITKNSTTTTTQLPIIVNERKNTTSVSSASANITITVKEPEATKFTVPIKPSKPGYRGPKIYLIPASMQSKGSKQPVFGRELLPKHLRINPYSTHSELLAAQNVQNYPYSDANQYVTTDYLNQIQANNDPLLNAPSNNPFYNPYSYIYPPPYYAKDPFDHIPYPPYLLPPFYQPPIIPPVYQQPKTSHTVAGLSLMENATISDNKISNSTESEVPEKVAPKLEEKETEVQKEDKSDSRERRSSSENHSGSLESYASDVYTPIWIGAQNNEGSGRFRYTRKPLPQITKTLKKRFIPSHQFNTKSLIMGQYR